MRLKRYPIPAAKTRELIDSFARPIIPGTNTPYARGIHGGIDASWLPGVPVLAGRRGRAVRVGNVWGSAYGNQVLLRHITPRGRRYSFFAHLETINVKRGDRIRKAGHHIGTLGATGQVTGPHLHYEVHSTPYWRQGLKNPYRSLERARKRELRRDG